MDYLSLWATERKMNGLPSLPYRKASVVRTRKTETSRGQQRLTCSLGHIKNCSLGQGGRIQTEQMLKRSWGCSRFSKALRCAAKGLRTVLKESRSDRLVDSSTLSAIIIQKLGKKAGVRL